jgi:RNA 2',3'-cyclic 3'-phosphodiesterase
MHRLFIGIDPPDEIKQALCAIMEGVSAARWQDDDQLHLTLRFIGGVDHHQANDIAASLASLRASSFDCHFAGVGAFDRRGKLHTLYAAAHPADILTRLHKKLDHLMVTLGLEADARSYVPHITVARINSGTGSIAHFLELHSRFASASFTVDHLCLYESSLGTQGARYDIVERYPLMEKPG